MITVTNQQTATPVDIAHLESKTHKLLTDLGYKDFDIGILLTDLETIQEYNHTYRHKDAPTDVLSFPYHENIVAGEKIAATADDEKNLGDIILCPQFIKDDLERWEKTLEERMDILLIHGLLHLLGYDHEKDEDYEVMKVEEQRLLDVITTK